MPLEGFQPIVLRTFGGLCTSIDRLSLGPGMSPNCTNVRFDPGTVGSRYGYTPFKHYGPAPGTAITATTPIYSIKPFTSGGAFISILFLTSLGATTGTLKTRYSSFSDTTLLEGVGNDARLSLKADAVGTRLYIAVTDCGVNGSGFPALSAFGRTRTLTWRGSAYIPRQIGIGSPAWKADATHYVKAVTGTGGLAVGNHYYAWLFIGQDGYISSVGTGGYFNVPDAATTSIEIKGAPAGGANVAARILAIGAVDDVNLFWLPNRTIIWDNTTAIPGAAVLTLTIPEDEITTLGEPVLPYYTVYLPSSPFGCAAYSNRLVLWGARAKAEQSVFLMPPSIGTPSFEVRGLPNTDFKGGYDPITNLPGYWAALGAGSTGFAMATSKDYLTITNPTLNHGISVTAPIDGTWLPVGSVPAIRIKCRWRDLSGGGLTATGSVTVTLSFTNSLGVAMVTPIPTYIITPANTDYDTYAAVSGAYEELQSLGPPPFPNSATAILTVKCTQAFGTSAALDIDWIEVYDGRNAEWQNTLRVSLAGDAETFDYATGLVTVPPDEGEIIRNVFRMRDALYIAKDRSLYITRDTGEEPIAWPVDLVDRLSGTSSPHGVGYGDGWVAIASRYGMALFDGASAQLISREITPTWNTIDWTEPCSAWVVVDPMTKQIRVGARTIGSSENNLLLVLDYTEGFGNPVPSGVGRKWSIDTVASTTAATSAAYHQGVICIDKYGTPRPIYTMTATPNTGSQTNVVTYQDSTLADALKWNDFPDVAVSGQGIIYATYETAPLGPELGRATFDRVVQRVRGSGYETAVFVKPDGTTVTIGASPGPQLTSTPVHDVELRSNAQETSVGIRLQMTSRSDWFILRRIGMFLKDATYGEFRGKQDHTAA